MIELGLSLGWSHREPVDRILRLVSDAELAGITTCWVIDSQLAMRDAFSLLPLLARETRHMRIGPGVTNLLTRHETVIANTLVTLGTLAPGRILAGIGAGDSAVYPLGIKPQPIDELRDGIERLRSLLAGEAVAGPDKSVRIPGTDGPPGRIYLAASQPRMLRLAGAVADGVIIMGPADPNIQRLQMSIVDEGARDAGREPGDITRDIWITMAVDGEERGVVAVRSWASAQARWLSKWKQVPTSLQQYEPEMSRAAAAYDFGRHLSVSAHHADVISDEFAGALAVVGSIDDCANRLKSIADTGAHRITVSLLSGGRERRLNDLLAAWRAAGFASSQAATE